MTHESRPDYSGDNESTSESTNTQSPKSTEKKPDYSTATHTTSSTNTSASVNSASPSNASSGKKTKKKLPQLGSLSALKADLEQQANQINKEIDQAALEKKCLEVWNSFREKHPSPSLSGFMKDARLIFNDMTLRIVVTSQLARASIVEQRDLFEEIRLAASPQILEIEFEIDSSAIDTPKHEITFVTTQDKYNALLAKNSILEQLVQKLNLKVDHD